MSIDLSKAPDFPPIGLVENPLVKKTKTINPFDLTVFSLAGKLDEMKKKMLEDKYVLGNIAIYGQSTVFYSPPNSGKTLLTIKLLVDGIKVGNITAKDVFYINADDNYKGLVNKLEIAEEHGFNMLAPGHAGFEARRFTGYLTKMIQEDTASGKIIILDTLKKFTDIMDKKVASNFMRIAREFVLKGGTLILLAHTNKNRGADGKLILGGTSDINDDIDCTYTIDVIDSGENKTYKTVIFENIKDRGLVAKTVSFRYMTEARSYFELIDSVIQIDKKEADEEIENIEFNLRLKKDNLAIVEIISCINRQILLKTDIVTESHKNSGISKKAINEVLARYDGINPKKHKWLSVKGDKNSQKYALLSQTSQITQDRYRMAKDGDY